MSSLFTYEPIQEAIDAIRDMLQKDDTLDERMVLSPDRIAELLETWHHPIRWQETSAIDRASRSGELRVRRHCTSI